MKGLTKSNFNDLRQIFDESKRSHTRDKHRHESGRSSHKQNVAAMYYDAKPSMVEGDNLFEIRAGAGGSAPGSQEPSKYDFERAKLKFDRGVAVAASSKGASTKGGASSKRNSGDCSLLLEKKSYNEALQMYDENLKRTGNKESGANYMKTSMNLDGLKVSDDEVSNGVDQ